MTTQKSSIYQKSTHTIDGEYDLLKKRTESFRSSDVASTVYTCSSVSSPSKTIIPRSISSRVLEIQKSFASEDNLSVRPDSERADSENLVK